MNILVTGGAGNVGKGVVSYLVARGHQVRVIDRKIDEQQAGVEYVACDITDFGAVREQARDMQGITHLAAYPYPGAAPGPEIFRVNANGTYNVFEAAAAEGIQRVTCASSINALGYNFGVKEFPIQYFPIDEAHPSFTTDPYSYSKQIVESIAEYYWRRDGISSTCLRMPWIYTITPEWVEQSKNFSGMFETAWRDFLALPAQEQASRVAKFRAEMNEWRAKRLMEQPWDPAAHEEEEHDPSQVVFWALTDFWAVLSVEDTAQAFEKSLLAEFEGSHALYLTERENSAGIDSQTLLRIFFPEVTERRGPISGVCNLVSYERARQLIGFEPRHILRERLF